MEGSGEGFAEQGGATTAGLQSGKQSMLDDRAGSEPNDRDGLVLREMPNGVNVWCGRRAEEETFFVYGEVFDDRTYAKTGVRVQDGDTVWDVGELVLLSGAACGRGATSTHSVPVPLYDCVAPGNILAQVVKPKL